MHPSAILISVLSLAALAAVTTAQFTLFPASTSAVTEVTRADQAAFTSTGLSDAPYKLVLYYSAQCPHCQAFAPQYEVTAKTFASSCPDLDFQSVECIQGATQLCINANVQAYPTIVLMKKSGSGYQTVAQVEQASSEEQFVANIEKAGFDKSMCTTSATTTSAPLASATTTTTTSTMASSEPVTFSVPVANTTVEGNPKQDVLSASSQSLGFGTIATAGGSNGLNATQVSALANWTATLSTLLPQNSPQVQQISKLNVELEGFQNGSSNGNLTSTEYSKMLAEAGGGNEAFEAKPDMSDYDMCKNIQVPGSELPPINGTPTYRRAFTCGLWSTFHSLTVQANESTVSPQATGLAIFNYIFYFFSCAECRGHFLETFPDLAEDPVAFAAEKWKTRDDLISWWNNAHNTVSERLKKEYKTEWNVASGHENFPAASSVSAVCPNSDKDSCSALDYLLATYCLDGPTQNCTRDMAQIVGAPAPGAGRQRQLRH